MSASHLVMLVAMLLAPASRAATVEHGCPDLDHKKGMTWGVRPDASQVAYDVGAVSVGCYAGFASCNPYQGDTSCCERRPILCLKKQGLPKPDAVPAPIRSNGGASTHAWNGATIGATEAVPGYRLTSPAVGDAFCVAEFGEGWRMAEHHDGNPSIATAAEPERSRFGWGYFGQQAEGLQWRTGHWTRIVGQRANCWDSA